MGFWPNGCFENRHVLVTGGTSGIGAAIAAAFTAEGARVTVTGIAEADAAQAQGCVETNSRHGAGSGAVDVGARHVADASHALDERYLPAG